MNTEPDNQEEHQEVKPQEGDQVVYHGPVLELADDVGVVLHVDYLNNWIEVEFETQDAFNVRPKHLEVTTGDFPITVGNWQVKSSGEKNDVWIVMNEEEKVATNRIEGIRNANRVARRLSRNYQSDDKPYLDPWSEGYKSNDPSENPFDEEEEFEYYARWLFGCQYSLITDHERLLRHIIEAYEEGSEEHLEELLEQARGMIPTIAKPEDLPEDLMD